MENMNSFAGMPLPNNCNGSMYQINHGDTLYLIARRHNISIELLLQANPSIDPYNLQVGSAICIPGVSPMPTPVMPQPIAPMPMPQPAPTMPMPQPVPFPMPEPVATPYPMPTPIATPYPMPMPMPTPIMPISQPGPSLGQYAPRPNTSPNQYVSPESNFPVLPTNPTTSPIGMPGITMPVQEMPDMLQCKCGSVYTIKKDDTIKKIQAASGHTFAVLQCCNPHLDLCNLMPGQQMCIPFCN